MINRAAHKLKSIAGKLTVPEPQRYGVVQKIVGMTIEAIGLNAPLGSICLIENSDGHRSQAQIVGFSEDAILMMSFSGPIGIEPE
ncbi:MAG: flagellum-specific ATP synthase FliI, partial [Gammaproteobacteria bacterium]|nr:flagellum-specific ATP synthase FliI [Gammaproteobacteria bacterium]